MAGSCGHEFAYRGIDEAEVPRCRLSRRGLQFGDGQSGIGKPCLKSHGIWGERCNRLEGSCTERLSRLETRIHDELQGRDGFVDGYRRVPTDYKLIFGPGGMCASCEGDEAGERYGDPDRNIAQAVGLHELGSGSGSREYAFHKKTYFDKGEYARYLDASI